MLVHQDTIRREILKVKDRANNPAIDLISKVVLYGKDIGYDVVLEGILDKKLYGPTLNNLIKEFGEDAYVFYMGVSFEETLKRHDTKPNKHEYGIEEMKGWWIEKDYLGSSNEHTIPEIYSTDDAVDFILKTIR